MIYDRPTHELMHDFATAFLSKGQIFVKKDAVDWFAEKYPRIRSTTVTMHVNGMSTNSRLRRHHPHIRASKGWDLFYKLDSRRYRLWEAENDPAPIYKPDIEMKFTDVIQEISKSWPEYKTQKTIDKNHESNLLVVNDFTSILNQWLPRPSSYKVVGSPGQGNISDAPWIATFDPLITSSAQDGFYPVYLFSTDLKRMYLSLALGVTQFDRQFGQNANSISEMKKGAVRIRALCQLLDKPERMKETSIDLGSNKVARRYKCYEAATIFAFPAYDLENLPEGEALRQDYQEMLGFYQLVATDPTIPVVEQLVDAAIDVDLTETNTVETYDEFSFRPKKKLAKSSKNTSGKRRSRESKKIGNAGEFIVYEAEKLKLERLGRNDLAEKIDHLAIKNQTPGWDITSFDEAGDEIYIEVKSTKGNNLSSVEITRNEWRAASNPKYSSNYYVYLVTGVFSSSPKIEVLKNPCDYIESKKLVLEPSVWELSFYERNEES